MNRSVLVLAAATVFLVSPAMAKGIDMGPSLAKLDVYMECVGAAVRKYAPSEATASEVVDAAEGSCTKEFGAFKREVEDAFTPDHGGFVEAYNREMADAAKAAEEQRVRVRSQAMAYVLDLRMQAAAKQPAEPPSK